MLATGGYVQMRRRVTVGCLVVLLVLGAGPTALAAAPTGQGAAAADDDRSLTTQPSDFDRTEFVITAYRNGSVEWLIRHTKPLNESTRPNFEDYATEFNTTETGIYSRFVERSSNLTAAGEVATDREMVASGFDKRAYVKEDPFTGGLQGVIEMEFRWSNFTETSADSVQLGDIFQGGLLVQANQRFTVEPGPALVMTEADPEPDVMSVSGSLRESDAISWEGERSFGTQRPYVAFEISDGVTTTQGGDGGTAGPPTTQPASTQGDGSMLVVGVIVLVLGLGTVVVWRLTFGRSGGDSPAEDSPGPDDSPGGAVAGPTGEAETDSTDTQPSSESATPSVTKDQLLTDTDRVQRLLDEHGGRMRQSAIVEETDWSKSKVSMLLSDMEDENEITKLRVGRENIISLPGSEPEAAGSPFDDDE